MIHPIKKWSKKHNISLAHLAKTANISQAFLLAIIHHDVNYSIETIRLIYEASKELGFPLIVEFKKGQIIWKEE